MSKAAKKQPTKKPAPAKSKPAAEITPAWAKRIEKHIEVLWAGFQRLESVVTEALVSPPAASQPGVDPNDPADQTDSERADDTEIPTDETAEREAAPARETAEEAGDATGEF